jgi:hypothetical protein
MKAEKYKVSVPEGEKGEWKVERFIIPENDFRALTYGIRAPSPGTYTRLKRKGAFDPMMSDTSAEVLDHWEVLSKLETAEPGTRVLINGLGIGMVLQAALRNENIEHVDVVELEKDVIDLVGPHYVKRTASGRLTIHHADAFTIQWPKGMRWNIAWHDIWPTLCVDDLEEHTKLTKRYQNRVDWQGCWGHQFLLQEKRRERYIGWR